MFEAASAAANRSRCSRARSLWRCTQPALGRRSLGASGAASTSARHAHGRGSRHVTHMSMSQYYGQRASRRILRRRWCLGSWGRSNLCAPALWLGSSGPLTCLSSTYAETINSCGLRRMRELDDVATRGKCCRFHARRTEHFENKQRAAARNLPVSAWKTSMESPSVRAAPATVSGAAPASAEAEEDSEAPKMRRKVFMACNASSTCALSNTTGPCRVVKGSSSPRRPLVRSVIQKSVHATDNQGVRGHIKAT